MKEIHQSKATFNNLNNEDLNFLMYAASYYIDKHNYAKTDDNIYKKLEMLWQNINEYDTFGYYNVVGELVDIEKAIYAVYVSWDNKTGIVRQIDDVYVDKRGNKVVSFVNWDTKYENNYEWVHDGKIFRASNFHMTLNLKEKEILKKELKHVLDKHNSHLKIVFE